MSDKIDWKDEIRTQLVTLFSSSSNQDYEGLARLLVFLDEEEKNCYGQGSAQESPFWKTLKAASRSDRLLLAYATQLLKDTKAGDKDETFRRVMRSVYSRMLEATDGNPDIENHQGWVALRPERELNVTSSVLGGLSKGWEVMPMSMRESVLQVVKRFGTQALSSTVDDAVALVNTAGGNVVMVGLALLSIGYDAYRNILRWWKGEITGLRCAKNLIDSTASVLSGISLGCVGVIVGATAGPLGPLVGGVIGSAFGSVIGGTLADRITQWIFSLPKEESLERAYSIFGVTMTASNHEINQSYRALCLQHHPDKGGDAEMFVKVQSAMGIIKAARNDFY